MGEGSATRGSPVRKPVLCNDVLGGTKIARGEEWGGGTREARAPGTGNQSKQSERVVLLDSCNSKTFQSEHMQ